MPLAIDFPFYIFINHYLLKHKLKIRIYYIFRPSALSSVDQSTNSSFIKKLKSTGRSLVVFYGSQTGTAEEFAGRIAKEGARYKMKGMVADPEECDMVNIL